MAGSFFIGMSLVLLFGVRFLANKNKKSKKFVCGHCESEDTLQVQKLRDRNVFTCSFCERIINEDILRLSYKDDYNMITNHPDEYNEFKKARKEGHKFEVNSQENHTDSRR